VEKCDRNYTEHLTASTITKEAFEKYNNETLRVSAIIWGLMRYLMGSDYKGFKFNRPPKK
jgi:hypothetical protein